MEVPIRVFSEEAKNEDFSKDGDGWNLYLEDEHEEVKEEEKKEKVDPRLASLKQFLKDKDE